jgi:NitT/TauT family transport system substrate-binding protein
MGFVLGLAALLCTGTLATAQELQKVSLRLDWSALGYHAPFYLGAANGIYERAGLEVEIGEGKGSSNGALMAGNEADDFSFVDATTTARLISEGLPAKVVMGIYQRSTLSLFYGTASGMSQPSDLEGKRLSMCPGDGLSVYMPIYLEAIDVAQDSVEIVSVDCSVKYTVVAQGQADAVASYAVAGKPLMQAVGIDDVARFDFADAGVTLPSFGIVTSVNKIQQDPDLVARFVEATQEAWAAAQNDPDAAVAAIVKARPLLQGKETMLKETLVDSFQYIETPGTAGQRFGWQSPDEWRQAVDILVNYVGMKRLEPDTFFTNEFVQD